MADAGLMAGCREGSVKRVLEALEYGADVNARDEDGLNALCLAAIGGHRRVAQILLSAGAEGLDEAIDEATRGEKLALAEYLKIKRSHAQTAGALEAVAAKRRHEQKVIVRKAQYREKREAAERWQRGERLVQQAQRAAEAQVENGRRLTGEEQRRQARKERHEQVFDRRQGIMRAELDHLTTKVALASSTGCVRMR